MRATILQVMLILPLCAAASTQVRGHLGLTTEERYDDAQLLDLETAGHGELMSKASPKLGLELKDHTFDVGGWYAADFYVRHASGHFAIDHRAGLNLKEKLSERVSAKVEGQLWRVSDPTSLPRLGLARSLSPVLYGEADGALTGMLTRRLQLVGDYRYETTQVFDGATPRDSVHAPSVDGWYQLTRRTAVGAGYRYELFTFGATQDQAHLPRVELKHRLTRELTLSAKGGPIFFSGVGANAQDGTLPMAEIELMNEGDRWELGAVVAQDLVGASGYASALWAQYGSLVAAFHATKPLRLYSAASLFRNAPAPGTPRALYDFRAVGVAQGYAFSVGGEYEVSEHLSLQVQLDRFAQVDVFGGQADTARNIASVRLVMTAW